MERKESQSMDLDALRAKLAGKSGKRYWRSLEEVAESEEFQRWMEDEFPNRKSLLEVDRRQLLKVMGASMALAGLSGCRAYFLGTEKIVPYVNQPEEMIPGRPMYYASTFVHNGYGTGILVEQHEGRPTKIEGNPDHPESEGRSDVWMQAAILSMYDPDRAGTVNRKGGEISTWESFNKKAREAFAAHKADGGAGLRILMEPTSSPTVIRMLGELQKAYPAAKVHVWSPVNYDNVRQGIEIATGQDLEPVYRFKDAKVAVSLDSDFLMGMPGHLRYAKDFADGRRVLGDNTEMNRLYAFESTPTTVGAVADHRWSVKPSQIEAVAAAILAVLGGSEVPSGTPAKVASVLPALVADLKANQGAALVVAGEHQSPSVHALAHRINLLLDAPVDYIRPVTNAPKSCLESLKALVADLNAGKVGTLLILGGNPVYDAPADLKFAEAMKQAKLTIHHSLYVDETGHLADWHLPQTHVLEEWGDARAYDGTVSLVQPLIAPLFEGKSWIEVISSLLNKPASGYDLVRETAKGWPGFDNFEKAWRRALHSGVVPNTKGEKVAVAASSAPILVAWSFGEGLEVVFRPDPHVFDGRYSNNGWLQELPKPLTQLTWENAAIMGVETAERLGLKIGDVIELKVGGVPVNAPVFPQPGHAENTITLHFGYGRTRGGTVATSTDYFGGGFNAFALRTTDALWISAVEAPRKVSSGSHPFATTQMHHQIEDNRDIVRSGTIEEYKKDPTLQKVWAHHENPEKYSLYPDSIFEFNGPQWGMTIDMNVCIGCNACAIACQAENNISVVGKEQVAKGREMHWIRIDRYYTGDLADPEETVFQPLACVHCEKAPCEPVCPVAATVHSHEGLNQMVYNRCVGTRYCSNNCPYKVRRFNYKNWSDNQKQFMIPVEPISKLHGNTTTEKTNGIPLLRMLNNPDVTVRGRGVMEKCTYCTQRISNVRIEAKKQGREPKDGEILTACQQACPTQAITFGNVADPESRVSKMRNDPRSYQLLRELQTRPRTSHMGRLRNPNPEIAA
jgi:molybdopterin-containing oxidoreductase family iron-sulfur binding subunit